MIRNLLINKIIIEGVCLFQISTFDNLGLPTVFTVVQMPIIRECKESCSFYTILLLHPFQKLSQLINIISVVIFTHCATKRKVAGSSPRWCD
jgi:hypothetical protein